MMLYRLLTIRIRLLILNHNAVKENARSNFTAEMITTATATTSVIRAITMSTKTTGTTVTTKTLK